MTDANGTQNNSNGPLQPTDQSVPTAKETPIRRSRSRSKVFADVDKSTSLSSRRSRRESVQRKRLGGQASGENRARRGPKGSLRGGESTQARQRLRSRKSPPLKLAGESTSGVNPTKISAPAGKKTPPNLSLARRRNVRRKAPVPLLYMGRLAVAGLGIAVIGGTILKALPDKPSTSTISEAAITAPEPVRATFPMTLGQENVALKTAMQELPNLYPSLTPKAFYIDVESGDYVDLEGTGSIAAASTIKLPVLLAFFDAIDEDLVTFNQTVALLPEQIAEGSGDIQFSSPGTQFTALEVATQMIVNSDNTATNMMIDLLGGPDKLNAKFVEYGLQKTTLNSPLPDLTGTNTTSAKDLVHTMLLISGDRLTLKSRDRILNILNRTYNKSLLAAGMVEKEALTYNKTGDIESVLGDVALVDLSNGKRYIVAALVERPSNDNRAVELIHRISDLTYEQADKAIQPAVTPLGTSAAEETSSEPQIDNEPDSESGGESGSESESATESVLEEEPYPSANP